MNININHYEAVWLSIVVLSYIIGFLTHKIFLKENNAVGGNIVNKNWFEQQKNAKNTIAIDEAKFVTDISTDGMEKKYKELGEIKNSNENINESINKLKNLKR